MDIDAVVRQAKDGNQQALTHLLMHFDRYVFGVALLTLGDRADAQDAAQEALIRALKGLKSYNGDAKFQTWLYRIVVNACRDMLRRRGRRREMVLDEAVLLRPDPQPDLFDAEQQCAVWRAVQSLDIPLREVVVLRYYLDFSGIEIGEITATPVNTVYWRLHQARKQLEPLLLSEEELREEIASRVQQGV